MTVIYLLKHGGQKKMEHFSGAQKVWQNCFRNAGQIKLFSNEGKLEGFVTSKTTLKDCLKQVLQTQRK